MWYRERKPCRSYDYADSCERISNALHTFAYFFTYACSITHLYTCSIAYHDTNIWSYRRYLI